MSDRGGAGVTVEQKASEYRDALRDAQREIARLIVGQERLIEDLFAALMSGGHALLEGVPGLGKTMLIRAFGDALDLQARRVQFTPDLMPADIIGTNTLVQDDRGHQEIVFQEGPIFTQILLADEINRATPKTQSALLEAMQEQRVSVGGKTYELELPFLVLATQNPLELEGTYPLPEAQLDRFFFKLQVPFPEPREMVEIMRRTTGTAVPSVRRSLDGARLREVQAFVRQVVLPEEVQEYAVRLVYATHPERPESPGDVRRFVRYGASPRGAQSLILAGKVYALMGGRLHVAPEDIRRAALPALRHRVVPSFRAEAEGVKSDTIVEKVLKEVPERSE
jgi:MoxR-like ATPase